MNPGVMYHGKDTRDLEFVVECGQGRIRLDDYLFAKLGRLSRMYLRELVKTGCVMVNGEFSNVGVRLRTGDFIEVRADMSRGTAMQPEDIQLEIVYEDDAVIVVNKPTGMLVHPTHRDKNGTLLNALSFYLNKNKYPPTQGEAEDRQARVRPGLVHRLDRETSGLILVAKTSEAHRRLGREFMKKRVRKLYVALVEGVVSENEGTVSLPIGRFAEKKFWDVKEDGKNSVTQFRILERSADSTLIELEPVTGRTNQLRIHCASIGHPIVGDLQRGGRKFERLCLHASKLTFNHPTTNVPLTIESPITFPLDSPSARIRDDAQRSG